MCNYCKAETRILGAFSTLAKLSEDKNYIRIEMNYAKKGENPYLLTQCASDNKVSRTTVDIMFCPMCGRKLGE